MHGECLYYGTVRETAFCVRLTEQKKSWIIC